jgi:hypothetical protein
VAFGDRFYLQGQQSVAHRARPVNGVSGARELLGISEATFHRSTSCEEGQDSSAPRVSQRNHGSKLLR